MTLGNLVAPNAVISALKATTKDQLIQQLAARAAALTGQSERDIRETLMRTEKLGTTGIGDGIAVPHGALANLERMFGLFCRLERPINYDALDGQPVDLVFLLLAPETAGTEHLKAFARIARLLRSPGVTSRLRASRDADALLAVLTMPPLEAA
jgi:PTS system nitrogen regulatory IIA component